MCLDVVQETDDLQHHGQSDHCRDCHEFRGEDRPGKQGNHGRKCHNLNDRPNAKAGAELLFQRPNFSMRR
jgi:hypothetical protein